MTKPEEVLEKWLFGRHDRYCVHRRTWFGKRVGPDGPCICDEPRAALAALVKEALAGRAGAR